MAWQLATAKNKLSQVIELAKEQPQWISRHGESVAVVISAEHFRALISRKENLFDFLSESPLKGLDLESTTERKNATSSGRKFDVSD